MGDYRFKLRPTLPRRTIQIKIMKPSFTLAFAVVLLLTGSVRGGWVTECLKDCDDLPLGHRAPCRADCFRGYNLEDCLVNCERFPAGSAQKNCQKHCIIFGDKERVKRSLMTECLQDCEGLPRGHRAPCRADCIRG